MISVGGSEVVIVDVESVILVVGCVYEVYDFFLVDNLCILICFCNKICYVFVNMSIDLEVRYKDSEFLLWWLCILWNDGWYYNEIGW